MITGQGFSFPLLSVICIVTSYWETHFLSLKAIISFRLRTGKRKAKLL